MPYCPTCKQPFASGVTRCPEHGTELVDELPFQTVEGPTSTWVEIASANTDDEARLIQGFLEAEGIPCQIENLKFHMEPVNLGTMGEIRVYVAAENESAALGLLRKREGEYRRLRDEESVVTDHGPAEIADDVEQVAEEDDGGATGSA